jgi:short-subunit dehydrogenase
MDSDNYAALITGASSGIGAMYADKLARRGYNLVLVARRGDLLEKQATRLSNETGRLVHVLQADLSDSYDLGKVEQWLRSDRNVRLLVNNAGIGATAPLLSSNVEKTTEMISLNVNALTRLTYAIAPRLVEQGEGAIINISSIVALNPERLNGVYGGTKAFVLAFSQSLHHELSDKGVRVQAVLPGATATRFWELAGSPVEHLPAEIVMTPEDTVDAALAGFDQGELVTIPSLSNLADWAAYEAARQNMFGGLSSNKIAPRYARGA